MVATIFFTDIPASAGGVATYYGGLIPPALALPQPGTISPTGTPTHANYGWLLMAPVAAAPFNTAVFNQVITFTITGTATYHDILGRWATPPLAAQTIPAQSWDITGYAQNQGQDAPGASYSTLMGWGGSCRVWRPSTQTYVGTIFDLPTSAPFGPTVHSTALSLGPTVTGSAVTCLAGDVLLFELWGAISTSAGSAGQRAELAATAPPATGNGLIPLTTGVTLLSPQPQAPVTCAGESTAGGFPLIESSGAPVAFAVSVDWTMTNTFVDESANVRSVSLLRGRLRATDQMGTGQCTVTFINLDGRYSPFNSGSPLYPNVVSGRPIRVAVTYHGVTYRLFTGNLGDVTMLPRLGITNGLSIICYDAADRLSRQQGVPSIVSGGSVDQAIALILAGAQWAGPARLDQGPVLQQYAAQATKVLSQLQDAAAQDLGGRVYIGADGAVVYENASHRASNPVLFVLDSSALATSPADDRLQMRATDLFDSVSVTYGGEAFAASVGVVYTAPPGLVLPPSSTIALAAAFTAGPSAAVTQPVSGTDFVFNAAADGTGALVTGNVSLSNWTVTDGGGGFATLISNSSAAPAYAQLFQVRGTTLSAGPGAQVIVQAPTQPYGQQLQAAAGWLTNTAAVRAWALGRLAALSTPRARPQLAIAGSTPQLTHLLLGATLGSRLVLLDASAAWLTGVQAQFFIEHLQIDLVAGQIPQAHYQLMDTVQGAA